MITLRDIALARGQTLETKEDKPPKYRAVIVEQRDSSGKEAVYVEGRVYPFYLWVRLWNSGGSVLPAFNADNVPAIAGTPVNVTRSRGSDQELEIVGIDKEALQTADLPVGFSNIGQHAWAHEMPDGAPGFDPVTVYPRSWSQLKTYSSDPLSLVVNVSPLRYYTGSGSVNFGGGVVDLTAAAGALAANQARLVLIYLDRVTNALGTANGAIGTIALGWFLSEPVMVATTYPSAVVRIYNGQIEIGETDIRDRRAFLNAAQASGWPFNTNVITVDTTDVDADVATVAEAIAASAAGDLILVSPETHVCDNQSLPAGVNLAGLDRDATLLQTTTQVIALTLDGNYLFRLTVDNDQSNAAAITAILVDDDSELRDVIAMVDNGSTGDARAISVTANVKDARLEDCDAEAISGAGNGYALYVAAASGTTEVRGGKYDGDTADIYVGAAAIVTLFGPTLVNSSFSGPGVIKGWWYDSAGHFCSLGGAQLRFVGVSGDNEIIVPDNIADALGLLDAGGIEYVRVVSTDANPYLVLFPTAGGQVGIGTVPAANFELHVKAAGAANIDVRLESGGGTDLELGCLNASYAYIHATNALNLQPWGGNVGVGMTAPQGLLHGYDGIGGFLYWEYDGIDGVARTVIPNGAGDVVYILAFFFAMRASDGTTFSAFRSLTPGTSYDMDMGAGTCIIAVAANGEVTLQRTVGVLTYKVALWMAWL